MPELGGKTPLEQCLREASLAGFTGVEYGGKFAMDSSELIPKLNKENLKLCSGWYGAQLLKRSPKDEFKLMQKQLQLFKDCKSPCMVFAEVTGSVTEYPKIDLKQIENINFDDYSVKVEAKEVDKRIELIAAHQNKFIDAEDQIKSKEGDLVVFDYKATVEGREFKGNEGKNTQLVLGKDLFIKGFDKQLIGYKKNDSVNVEANLPENFPEKEYQNKKAVFNCKILAIKHKQDVKIDDEFAKSVGAKDLTNLKEMVSQQVSEELINSLSLITSKQIIKQIEKFKIEELPKNILDEEFKILTQGMKEDEIKKNKKSLEDQAKSRIKTGLIMNEYGEKNQINVTEQEMQNEIQKQLRMMPGQEKMVQEYYQKNPSVLANLRGSLYEEKIIKSIKEKAKGNKKNISKDQAEKIIKDDNKINQDEILAKKSSSKTAKPSEKSKKQPQKKTKLKKVSKK